MNVIVLAAGRGTRMRSRLPKVLHPVLGRSMLEHVLTAVHDAFDARAVVVADPELSVRLRGRIDDAIAIQSLPLGTADAVAAGLDELSDSTGSVVVLNGDVPLIRSDSLQQLTEQHRSSGAMLTLGTFEASGSTSYGRMRRRDGKITGIVEARDDSSDRTMGYEANGGIYCFDLEWLKKQIGQVHVSASGEYYLTSLVAIAARASSETGSVGTVLLDETELLGVDDRIRLAEAEKIMRLRVLREHMRAGVTIVDPERTVIEPGVRIQSDVRIEPGCFLRGDSSIAEDTIIGPYTVIENSHVGRHCTVIQSWLENTTIADRVRVGPFSRLRTGTIVLEDAFIGNFVETKQTEIGAGSDVHHMSYLGDATLGSNVNVGAGTITCNYDGVDKHRTIVGNDVFVGCDTMLVAPVELGDGSRTGAGAVVTRSVPAGQTVVGVPAKRLERRVPSNAQENHGR